MRVKTSELSGAALDWAVAKCEEMTLIPPLCWPLSIEVNGHCERLWLPSINWAQGGPIIEREKICVGCGTAYIGQGDEFFGKTNLIAGMRCYVASKLGDEIEIPEELI